MAIKVGGTTVIDDSRALQNIASVDATTVTALSDAGVGGGFEYDAVSGATQDLDLDNGNFFDGGTLTADTTLTFSNEETESRWSYTAKVETSSSTAFDPSTYTSVTASRALTNSATTVGLYWKADGLSLYVIDQNGDKVHQYSLSTAFDISTLSFTRTKVVSEAANPGGISFSADGTSMYVSDGASSSNIDQWTLSTAWDISTASHTRTFSTTPEGTKTSDVFVGNSGLAMYVLDIDTNQSVSQYTLSTAYDISTASFTRSLDTSALDGMRGLSFSPDGTHMLVAADTGKMSYYILSTAWDLSSATLDSTTAYGVSTQGVAYNPNGGMIFRVDGSNIYKQEIGSPSAFTFPSSVQNPPTTSLSAGDRVHYEFYTSDGGTNVYLINESIT